MERYIKICEFCNRKFSAKRRDARFCSGTCRADNHLKKKAIKPRKTSPLLAKRKPSKKKKK